MQRRLKFSGATLESKTGPTNHRRERDVYDVDSFEYLGAKIDKQGRTASNIRARLVKARVAFNKLDKV